MGVSAWHTHFYFYTPMHEVTPKVVAMAVSTVMTMWRIFPQILLLSIF
jgi:hypothetical protein